MTTQTIDISMTPAIQILPEVFCSQYDNGIRQVVFNLFTDDTLSTPYRVDGMGAIVQGTKPDGNAYAQEATASGSSVTVTIGTQMAAVAGITPSEIVLRNGSWRIGSINFLLMVEPAGIRDDAVVSDSEIPPYVNRAKEAAEAAEASATAAQKSATNAAGSAAAAGDSATAAAGSAAAAGDSATAAAGSATAAGDSATAAAGSATAAADSATAAENAAATAAAEVRAEFTALVDDAEGAAEDSEAWAVGQRNGVDVPATDPTYHNNAKYWAGQSAGQTIEALSDVNVDSTTLEDGQVLVYNSTDGKWENGEGMPAIVPIERGGTGNADGYIRTGQLVYSTIGSRATAEGVNTTASGSNSHAEGSHTAASGSNSHAEGYSVRAHGNDSHAGGRNADALNSGSFVHGYTSSSSSVEYKKFNNGMPKQQLDGFTFGYSPTTWGNLSYVMRTHTNIDRTIPNSNTQSGGAKNGLSATIGETATLTLQLEAGAIYVLFCNSFTISTGALYGATARMISCLPTEDGTPSILSLGATSNQPATIAAAANHTITIKNSAATRATQFTLIRVA